MEIGFGNKYGNPGNNKVKLIAVRNIDLVSISPASSVIFQPFNGKRFLVTQVKVVTKTRSGTITTEPVAKLTDGTNDIVAAVAVSNTNVGRAKSLTVVTDRLATYAAPLTLTKTVAAAGTNPVVTVDLFIEGYLL